MPTNPCEIFLMEKWKIIHLAFPGAYKTALNKIENKLEVDKLDFKLYPNPVKESLLYISISILTPPTESLT
jgi:hypothetical protein